MARSYNLLPRARLDLENIFQYISVELVNPESAIRLIEKFETKFKDICLFPKAYPKMENPGLDHHHLRKTHVEHYLIVYVFDEEEDVIDIVRVVYVKKNFMQKQ